MSGDKNINSAGENTDSEGDFADCVRTARTPLNTVLSFSCRGLPARWATVWRCAGSDTPGERGA